MSYNYNSHNEFPQNVRGITAPGELDINATHFSNAILLQIRLNGEMNCTLDVTRTGLRPVEQDVMHRPIAGIEGGELKAEDDDEEDEEIFIRDNLSDYNVHIRLGDPNDPKLPVIATQIAELYQHVIIPTLQRGHGIPDDPSSLDIMITLSSKIWSRGDSTDEDFSKLVFVLKCIKEMYQQC